MIIVLTQTLWGVLRDFVREVGMRGLIPTRKHKIIKEFQRLIEIRFGSSLSCLMAFSKFLGLPLPG